MITKYKHWRLETDADNIIWPHIDKANVGANVKDGLMLRLLNETQACLREGVISNSNLLDAGVIFGAGFAPFRGEPMHYIDNEGADSLLNKIRNLHESHGKRFSPDENWNHKT